MYRNRSRALLNQNKSHLPAASGREERRGSLCLKVSALLHTHTALPSVRLDAFGGNLTHFARLAQPITTQSLAGTETGRVPSCSMSRL